MYVVDNNISFYTTQVEFTHLYLFMLDKQSGYVSSLPLVFFGEANLGKDLSGEAEKTILYTRNDY